MIAHTEKTQVVAQIWQLVQELTLLEKLALSEQLMADVRRQLLAEDQPTAQHNVARVSQAPEVDESDSWSDQDLVELREASIQYARTTVWQGEQEGD